jgi:thiol-disulfide isomerase/thioredoxin
MNTPPDRRALLLTLAAAALGSAAVGPSYAKPAAAGEPVSWPQVGLLEGGQFGAAMAEGKAVVAVFWSTTCPFCRRHNAHIEKLRLAAAGRPLEVIGIARETDMQAVQRYMRQQGWHFAVTLDYPPMAAALSTRNMIPLTVTVDRQGRLRQVFPGEMREEDVLELLHLAG